MPRLSILYIVILAGTMLLQRAAVAEQPTAATVDFNRDIRSILSNKCYACHGPDEKERQAGLRFDSREAALAPAESGTPAIVPGNAAESELVRRITSTDDSERMPPVDSGRKLSPREIELLTAWVQQGAAYAQHWSYVKPQRPPTPDVAALVAAHPPTAGDDAQTVDAGALASWPRNDIDRFLLARLLREGLRPTQEADRYALIRRLSLDLTGLPPTIEEVDQFVNDADPEAYERLVDRLLAKDSYGEHWARMWLDLARYADSAGYADDPPRTAWGFRDYVIRSLNANKPFDQFTIEQIAGDLLPNPTDDQLIATCFHRNTLTNNEGGTSDEEFRNVAVVDRVNTTFAVWMGTTINCAQCHSHKYDPISQEEFFKVFAIFNNTQDADRRDESPLIDVWTAEQEQQKTAWRTEIAALETKLQTTTPDLVAAQAKWEERLAAELSWRPLIPSAMQARSGAALTIVDTDSIRAAAKDKTDVYNLDFAPAGETPAQLAALRLEVLPDESLPGRGPGHAGGNFVVSQVLASVVPPQGASVTGRFVRIDLPGVAKILSLAEVQVFRGSENVASTGTASQSSVDYEGHAKLAMDGNTDGRYYEAKSTTHTAQSDNPWWEVDLQSLQAIDRIAIWNRTDNNVGARLANFKVLILNEKRETVWEQAVAEPPSPSRELALSGIREIKFAAAFADFTQTGFEAAQVIDNKDLPNKGWAVGPELGKPHWLTLIPSSPAEIAPGSTLKLTIEQVSKHEQHTLGHFRVQITDDGRAAEYAQTPATILALLRTPADQRTDAQRAELTKHYLGIAPELKADRDRLTTVKKQLADVKPYTTVPIQRELASDQHRKTLFQYRGNFLDTGPEVTEGVPAAFHALPADHSQPDRMALAKWLVDENNPLTARVIVNRYWEALFGIGIVKTSEEFGSQGDLPTHPELLDWLATEFTARDWNVKSFLKLLVTSAAYRQSSRVTPELMQRDPDNLLLARGPRFRLSAEMVRDQALFVSGLLSPKLYGPPVKPPQPQLGVSAAFGSGIDWQTSDGDDRYRRGLYTTWRRSNPYPSMAAFDAPNREVCTLKRDRTNTPLQALVTLNDPVYIEAAQALARRVIESGSTKEAQAATAFRRCLARPPHDHELTAILNLYDRAYATYSQQPEAAKQMATNPLGAAPEGSDTVALAAWTVVGNVLLNLDEMFLKR